MRGRERVRPKYESLNEACSPQSLKTPEFLIHICDYEQRILQSLNEFPHRNYIYKAIFLLHLHHRKTFWQSPFITLSIYASHVNCLLLSTIARSIENIK